MEKDNKYGKEDEITDTFAGISWAIMGKTRIFKRLKNHVKQNYKNDCPKKVFAYIYKSTNHWMSSIWTN